MILANLRAGIWRYSAFALGVLAVALLITGLVFRVRAADAVARADAAELRAEALQTELQAAKDAAKRDDTSADATNTARAAAAARRPEQAARAERVKEYADAAGDVCVADADLLRESQEATGRIRAAEDRLRGQ